MNRRLILLFTALLMCGGLSAQSMKMVVDDKGEVVGRFVKTNATTYTVSVQDDGEVPKAGKRVVTFSAEKGQGIVYPKNGGNINVRKSPTVKSPVVAKIPEFDGIPDAYDCLGKVNGWYKIEIDGKTGYVRADLMKWDGMCSF
mgnify:CR=1 FL=1